jgi:hypothetical protein
MGSANIDYYTHKQCNPHLDLVLKYRKLDKNILVPDSYILVYVHINPIDKVRGPDYILPPNKSLDDESSTRTWTAFPRAARLGVSIIVRARYSLNAGHLMRR